MYSIKEGQNSVLDFLNAICTQQKQNVSQMLTLFLLVSGLQLVISMWQKKDVV